MKTKKKSVRKLELKKTIVPLKTNPKGSLALSKTSISSKTASPKKPIKKSTLEKVGRVILLSGGKIQKIISPDHEIEKKFIKKSELQKRKLSIEELSEYYREKRAYEYDNGIPLKGIEIRKKLNYLIAGLLKLDRKLKKETLTVVEDKRVKSKIYVCTHIGGSDAERICEGLRDHGYFLSGDPGTLYREFAGVLLFAKGTVDVELKDKKDRYISKQRCIELLKRGGNLIIFSEGAWNITDSVPVMKLYPGAVEMAIESGAEIVPVALEQDDKDWYISFGKSINYESETNADKKRIMELTNNLRDVLATLKWNIWERISPDVVSRDSIDEDFEKKFHQNIEKKFGHGYTRENIERDKYKDKFCPEPAEAYSFVKKLVPNKNNISYLRSLYKQIR